MIEGAGDYRKGAFRCDFDCLMRRKANTATIPIQDQVGFCAACWHSLYTAIAGEPKYALGTRRARLSSQRLVYDSVGWTPTSVDISATTFPTTVTGTSPKGAPTWQFDVDVNPADGFKITNLKLKGRPGDPYQAAEDVCESIEFQDIWVALDGGPGTGLAMADAFDNTASPPQLEQAANGGATGEYLAGVKLTLTWAHSSGWQIQAAISMTVRDKRNDFDPGGAAEACKFYPQIALRYYPPSKGTGKLPKVTGLGGSIVLRTNNVIPTSLGPSLDPSLAPMANGMLSSSLFVDSNNSDFDNTYTLAQASFSGAVAGWTEGRAPAAPFGIWKGDWQSGRKLAGVINPTALLYLLNSPTARVAHVAAGYPGLPHWSWLFDYCWPNFNGTKQFAGVYQAGEKSGGGHQDVVRTLPVTWPLPVDQSDSQGIGYLTFLAGRLPDITQIEPLLRQAATGTVPAALGVASGDDQSVIDAATDWVSEFDSFALSTAPSADTWQPSRLEHQFAITAGSPAGTPFSLAAASWPGRPLDWSDFDISARADIPAPGRLPVLPGVAPSTGTASGTGPPHPLTYPGAPPRRFWTFDDANINLAAVTVSTDDLARMLIVEFATVYANDWYLLPIQLPCGALHTIGQLTITNSFGDPPDTLGPVALSIPAFGSDPAGTPDWCMFRQTVIQPDGTDANLNGLLLLTSAAAVQSSAAAEEVVFIRDDTADLGWAVEHMVLGADDRPMDRYSAAAQQTLNTLSVPPSDDGSTVRYLLETDVPVYCFPLTQDPSGLPQLDLLVLRRVGADGQLHDVPPLGQLLPPLQTQPLFDQELAAEGTTVRRRRYLIRGYDGEPLLWSGRERAAGGYYGSIPIAFDQVTAPPAAEGGT